MSLVVRAPPQAILRSAVSVGCRVRLVAAQFRGSANDVGASLTRALEGIQHGLDGSDPHPEPNDTELARVR